MRNALVRLAEAIVDVIVVKSAARQIARFVLREMFEPSTAFERLYSVIGPILARACAAWARATGDEPESEATRLAVFTPVGQALFFRLPGQLYCGA